MTKGPNQISEPLIGYMPKSLNDHFDNYQKR